MQKKILLTGASGFLGSHLLESFIYKGFDVAVLIRSTSDLWRISHLLDNVKVYDIRGRLITEKSNVNSSDLTLNSGSTNQVLIVKITSLNNEVVTKKVIN